MDEELRLRIEEDLKVHDRIHMASLKSLDDDSAVCYLYTIGNFSQGLPELLIIGLDPPTGAQIANVVSDRLKEMDNPVQGMEDIILQEGGLAVRLVVVGHKAKTEWMHGATEYLGRDDYDVIQVVLPDFNGKFPSDPECEEPFNMMPILKEVLH